MRSLYTQYDKIEVVLRAFRASDRSGDGDARPAAPSAPLPAAPSVPSCPSPIDRPDICESKTSSPGPGGVTLSNSFALTPPGPLAAGKLGRAEFGLFFAFAHRFNELDAMFKQSNALPATLGLCASHCNARSTTA